MKKLPLIKKFMLKITYPEKEDVDQKSHLTNMEGEWTEKIFYVVCACSIKKKK